MVTRIYAGSDNIARFRGLSTDEKPRSENGAEFLEIDTGMKYYYDGVSHAWITPEEDGNA